MLPLRQENSAFTVAGLEHAIAGMPKNGGVDHEIILVVFHDQNGAMEWGHEHRAAAVDESTIERIEPMTRASVPDGRPAVHVVGAISVCQISHITGPAFAFLVDELVARWRRRIDGADPPALLKNAKWRRGAMDTLGEGGGPRDRGGDGRPSPDGQAKATADLRRTLNAVTCGQASRGELELAAVALVAHLRQERHPPEQMLVRIKELLAEAGLRPSYAATERSTAGEDGNLYRDVIAWCIRSYYESPSSR